jgi:AraC-like DNA-binding protein
MSETSFYVRFKEWSGTSPVKYRNGIRISAACSLLKNSNLSVYEIAVEVGFEDPYYFSRIFKKIVGLSPRQVRYED